MIQIIRTLLMHKFTAAGFHHRKYNLNSMLRWGVVFLCWIRNMKIKYIYFKRNQRDKVRISLMNIQLKFFHKTTWNIAAMKKNVLWNIYLKQRNIHSNVVWDIITLTLHKESWTESISEFKPKMVIDGLLELVWTK